MENFVFLKSRDQKLLVALIYYLVSDLYHEVRKNLDSLPVDADDVTMSHHDLIPLKVHTLCELLEFIIAQFKSTLV